MAESKIFEYKSDWFQYFESVLKNEYKDDKDFQNKIKANIVESNYSSIKEFEKNHNEIKLIPSKESAFYNVQIKKQSKKSHYLYLDIEDDRFWVIHNIESQEEILAKINEIFCKSYLQDHIYIPNQMMEKYWTDYSQDSMGVGLKFDQLFIEKESTESDFEYNIDYTLRLWPKRRNTMKLILNKFKEINLPINYNYLNYVFQNENNEVLMKENFFRDGRFTIEKGLDFYKHIKFVDKIKEDYRSKIEIIEENRVDWEKNKGELFRICFQREIDPNTVVSILMENFTVFRIYLFYLYKSRDYYFYECLDEHTGGKFGLQVFNDKLYINLNSQSCGNVIMRLFTNLQKHLSPELKLEIDNEVLKI